MVQQLSMNGKLVFRCCNDSIIEFHGNLVLEVMLIFHEIISDQQFFLMHLILLNDAFYGGVVI